MKYYQKENGSVLSLPHRFFVEPSLIFPDVIFIPEKEAQHIFGSFRYRVGDKVEFFDGQGNVYYSELISKSKAKIIDKKSYSPMPYRLVVAQGVLKGKKMDFVVKRLSELGVYGMIPVFTEYSVALPHSEKTIRWKRLSVEAAKQSRNPFILRIWDPVDFESFVASKWSEYDVKFFLDTSGGGVLSVKEFLKEHEHSSRFLGVIGPEGGFSNTERKELLSAGFTPVVIRGGFIFRSEIASLLLGGMFLYEYEN